MFESNTMQVVNEFITRHRASTSTRWHFALCAMLS